MDKEINFSTVSSPAHSNPLSDLSKDQLLQLIGEALITTKKNNDNNHNNNNNNNSNNNNNNYTDNINDNSNIHTTNNIEANNILSREIVSPYSKNDSITLSNCNNIEHFLLPLDEILQKLNKIQSESLLLGNKDLKLKNWFTSLKSLLESCIIELNQDKEKMNVDFKNSLDTITKIFLITSRFSNSDLDNEFNLSLNSTSTIQSLINDYNNDNFISLENYCDENNSMFTLNKDIEDNILKLIPILSKNLINYKEKLVKFYSLIETIDDYKVSNSILDNIPTRDEIITFKNFNKIQNVKSILNSNFNKISPFLQNQVDNEINKINNFINERFQKLVNMQSEMKSLFNILYEKNEAGDLNNNNHTLNSGKLNFKLLDLSNKEKFLEKFKLKSTILTECEEKLFFLEKLKKEREKTLNNYLLKVKSLWSILRPNSNEIQNFLKLNNNLLLKSLNNFEILLKELELEKMENIAKFIESTRSKIIGYWDLLMYDEETRKCFKEFFINDVSLFDEKLLNLHSVELEKLRIESHNLKPLLKSIGFLNELLDEKTQLENSTKDPTRLLKRNSFKILRQEEKIRDKLKKLLPVTVNELKEQITNHESQTGRIFKINKRPYLLSLNEIENSFTHKRIKRSFPISPSPSKSLSASNSIKKQKLNRSPLRATNKHPVRSRISTPANSVIRKRHPNELSNPFLSRDPTPLKIQKPNTVGPLEKSNLESNSGNSLNSLKFPNTSISKSPIVIKGGSPMRSLNLAASKVILTNDSKPTVKLSPPFSANKKEKFKYPKLNETKLPLLFNSNILENNSDRDNNLINKNGKRVASNQLNPSLIPVEELSDSMIEYSEIENKEQDFDKENIKPIDDTYKIEKFLIDDGLQNTTWDMETF